MTPSMRLSLILAALVTAAPVSAQLVVPEIPYDSAANLLTLPDDVYLGEAAGVATNSQGHIYVYTRTGSPAVTIGTERNFMRASGGARLFEFDQNGRYVREIGQGLYGFIFAHAVRVDPDDNVWVVDRGSNMVIKFDPQGRVLMTMGRRPEGVPVPSPPAAEGGGGRQGGAGPQGVGARGDNFNRPTDVAWDAAGNIFVADGYGNARVAKFDRNGRFLTSWGSRGSASGEFDTLHSIAVDAQGSVYVADRDNQRIQVFDNDGTFKTQFINVGSPWAICITPGPHQYLYSSNSNSPDNLDHGEIYKMELDGRIVGRFGHAGRLPKEFGTVNEIDCRRENELLVGELLNWRVQKLTLRPGRN